MAASDTGEDTKLLSLRKFERELQGCVHVIRPGEVNLDNGRGFDRLEEELTRISVESELSPPKVVINLDSVEKLSPPALVSLLACRMRFVAKGGKIALCCVQPTVKEQLRTTRLDRLLPCYASEAAAVENLRRHCMSFE